MKRFRIKEYIKLGTALVYLIGVGEGEEFAGKHILSNIDIVLKLIRSLDFISTLNSDSFRQLEEINIILIGDSANSLGINKDQSNELEEICVRIRESLFTEGDKKLVYYQESGTNKQVMVKNFVALGANLRYLIDAKKGEPLGGKHILYNIDIVLELIRSLDFTSTINSAGFRQLKEIKVALNRDAKTLLNLSEEKSSELNRICRKIRESLFTEGDKKFVYYSETGGMPSTDHFLPSSNVDSQNGNISFLSQDIKKIFLTSIIPTILITLFVSATAPWWYKELLRMMNSETESKIIVNLFCTWKSQAKLTKPIESAAVTAISMRTGNSIDILGKGIDSDGRISFEMGRNDIVAVTIRHPDIRDSQVQIPNIRIDKSEEELKELNYTVSKTNCYFDGTGSV